MVQGPENNLWFAENTSTGVAIGVYVTPGGTAISGVAAAGAVAESVALAARTGTAAGITSGAAVSGMASSGGYVWVTDTKGDLIRVTPGSFGGTVGNDTVATGIVILLGGTTTTASTTAPGIGLGLAADSAPSPLPGLAANGSLVAYPGGTGSIVQVSPIASPTSVPGGSFLTGVASTDLKTASVGTFSQTNGGIIYATNSNYWTPSTSQFLFTNLGSTGSVQFANGLATGNGGGVVQGGVDRYIFTLLGSTNAMTYTSTDGSITGNIPLGNTTASCTGLTPVTSAGEGLITISNYFIWASSSSFCIVVP